MGHATTKRPLWRCPKCGHRFVTRNMWHSCTQFTLDHHFEGKQPKVRRVFDALLRAVEAVGPVEVISQKTRIAIQARIRFAGGVTCRDWFRAALLLPRPVSHRALIKTEKFSPNCYGHYFRLARPEDVDKEFKDLIREAYAVGCQEHLG